MPSKEAGKPINKINERNNFKYATDAENNINNSKINFFKNTLLFHISIKFFQN